MLGVMSFGGSATLPTRLAKVLFVPAASVFAEKALLTNNMCFRSANGLLTYDNVEALERAAPYFPLFPG